MTTTPTAAAIYCRISYDSNGEALGVDRQEELCRELAEREGWPVAATYIDNHVSAYSGRPRPEYDRMLADLRAGRVDAVVVWHPDRLHRSPRELEGFIDVVEATGAQVRTVTAGMVDLASAAGRMNARIGVAIARQESEHKSERLRAERAQRAQHGKSHPGAVPYGYAPDTTAPGGLAVIPEQADRIRDAARRILAGESMGSIVTAWNAAGVRTSRGGPWRLSTLQQLLARPALVSLRVHHGEVIGEGAWEAILDRETWERLAALFATRKGSGRQPTAPLTNILVCSLCGHRMICTSKGRGKGRVYRCRRQPGERDDACGRVQVRADAADQHVRELIARAVASGALEKALAARSDNGIARAATDRLRAAERTLDTLAADYGAGRVTRRFMLAASEAAEQEADAARRDLAAIADLPAPDLPTDAAGIRAWWDGNPPLRRRLVMRLVGSIPVYPADPRRPRTFDPKRLGKPEWRA